MVPVRHYTLGADLEYFKLEPKEARIPKWAFNTRIDDGCPWVPVQTRLLPPCAVPNAIPTGGSVFQVCPGPKLGLVAGSLKAGVKLNVEQLDSVLGQLKVNIAKTEKKAAKVAALVERLDALLPFYFADTAMA